jgi:hypothetical protein
MSSSNAIAHFFNAARGEKHKYGEAARFFEVPILLKT